MDGNVVAFTIKYMQIRSYKFAYSYLNTIIGLPWKYILSLKELCYAKQLKLDLENQKVFNDFGLHMPLDNLLFKEKFINFTYSPNLPIYEFPLLYEFVKSSFENTKNISFITLDLHEERKRIRMENINEDNSLNYSIHAAQIILGCYNYNLGCHNSFEKKLILE
ncbi:hypothetical protein RhiirA5_506445 [Rhizophagus irregularis]|uniref:Uncharacterized protein n=1 Tax=Rhizophagus irregularis TaxID=588596 RepID=A0A2I1FFW5_9GLOM|nr:hypothetical protein RhiirA5_506445 [Rhizophagus irregularis]PKC55588.1 hypothetical protein RhiirA1_542457 [Rhizophagus irregularis]PKY33261.1 hypothetical protein RhiirB3_532404 [Rhizophagus irregularis]